MKLMMKRGLLISGLNEDGNVAHIVVRVNAWELAPDENGGLIERPIYDCPEAAELRFSVSRVIYDHELEDNNRMLVYLKAQALTVDDAYWAECERLDAEEEAENSFRDFHSKLAARDWAGLGWFRRQTPPEGTPAN